MYIEYIRKRDGRVVPFRKGKITKAIFKAAYKVGEMDIEVGDNLVSEIITLLHETDADISETEGFRRLIGEINDIMEDYEVEDATIESIENLMNMLVMADNLADEVVDRLEDLGYAEPGVETIQDIVEKTLIENGHARTAKEFILYRADRTRMREMSTELMKVFEEITFADVDNSEVKRENGNVDGNSSMGIMLRYGSEGAKEFNLKYLIPDHIMEAHKSGDIHIHDLDFYNLTLTCVQIDIEKLFEGGFNTGHGALREPGEIRSYAALACIAIQANQNDMHGGQSIPAFDYYLAPGVAKTFVKQVVRITDILYNTTNKRFIESMLKEYRKKHRLIMNQQGYDFIRRTLKDSINNISDEEIDRILDKAREYTNNETYQAMEAVVHNLNSMNSRAGSQVPFSSLNFGTDTSEEGRMVSENLLLSTEAGLGNGETPIFPITIFKLKDGISLKAGDPNYDLFKLACRVSAKRLYPNFVNLDAPYNAQYYKEGRIETEVATMGCRTRVVGNVHDPDNEIVTSRGNLSFTTINLPRLGILAGEGKIEEFYELLYDRLELTLEQLMERYRIQCLKKPKNFPFLMGQGIWLGSEELGPNDDISEILKHGTLSIGFIGLAECLVALTGEHHGESEKAEKLGLEIIGRMRKFCDDKSKELKMNVTLLATPAESLSGRFTRIDQKKFGKIQGVTDKEYYTNSFHVPVYFPISAFKKIRIEEPYHALCNAGHITYIELDGDPSKNLDAFETIISYMHKHNIGYGAINHPVDRDPVCGYTGIIDNVCPRCGRKEGEPMTEEMWQRIKGYVGVGNADTLGTHGDPYEEADRIPNKL